MGGTEGGRTPGDIAIDGVVARSEDRTRGDDRGVSGAFGRNLCERGELVATVVGAWLRGVGSRTRGRGGAVKTIRGGEGW